MKKTIFLDIDGCIIKHTGDMNQQIENPGELLPGVKEKFVEWDRAGHTIILTTGRRESLRAVTEAMLLKLGLFYDQLIMGLPRGPRVLINDFKPGNDANMAWGICVPRNEGLTNVGTL
jgi:hypothetical protein